MPVSTSPSLLSVDANARRPAGLTPLCRRHLRQAESQTCRSPLHAAVVATATTMALAVSLLGPMSPASAAETCTPTGGANNCVFIAYSGDAESFTVPAGVTSVRVTLNGAGGGSAGGEAISQGGQTTGTVAVVPGEVLAVTVGRFGDYGGTPAYGGGGSGGGCFGSGLCGQGGGGLTGLWAGNSPFDRGNALLIAGGGGGSGAATSAGGVGGGDVGTNGMNGTGTGGVGGTATAPGLGGSEFSGGNGTSSVSGGGGGGGGWFGGGNGFGAELPTGGSGGGGGSGYIGGAGVTAATTLMGAGSASNENGNARLQWTAPSTKLTTPASGTVSNQQAPAVGGTGSAGNTVTITEEAGSPTICSTTVQSDGSWSCVPGAPLGAGVHTLIATETNALGFFYPASSPSDYTVDLTPPTIPAINGPSMTESTVPRLTGTSDAGTEVTVTNADGATVCTSTATAQATWSCAPATPLRLGANALTPSAVNRLGNSAVGTVFIVTVVDPPPPPTPYDPVRPAPVPLNPAPPNLPPIPPPTAAPPPAGGEETDALVLPIRMAPLSMNLRFAAAQLTPGTVSSLRGTIGPNTSAGIATLTFTGRIGKGLIYRSVTIVIDGETIEMCTVRTRHFTCSITLAPGDSAGIEVRLFADVLNAPDTAIQQLTVTSSDPQQDNAMTVSSPLIGTSDTDQWASMFQLSMSSLPGAFLPLLAMLLLALTATAAEAERRRTASDLTPTTEPGASQ